MEVMYTVPTIEDLKGVDVETVQLVYINVNGGLFYRYEPESCEKEDGFLVISSLSNSGRWYLNHNGEITILMAGGVGDGVTDNFEAMKKAHAASPIVYYPEGTYLCSQQLVLSGKHGIIGDGIHKTKLLFTGAKKGIKYTQSSATDGFNFEGISFLTNTADTKTTALQIDGTPQITTLTDGYRYILGNRNVPRGTVGRLSFSGVDNSSGWGVGLNMLSMMNYSVDEIFYSGVVPSVVGNLTGVALLINGDGAPTDIRINKIWSFYSKYVCLMPDYIEGVHIDNFEAVPTTHGIVGKYSPEYSTLPYIATGCLGVFVSNGHLNCLQAGIDLRRSNSCKISNLDVALQARQADSPACCVYIQGGNYHKVSDITMSGDASLNNKMQNRGLVLDFVGRSRIEACSSTSLEASVKLVNSSGNRIVDCEAFACANVVNGDTGSTNNTITGYKGAGNLGIDVSVALDNNVILKEHSCNKSVTFNGSASTIISVPLPIGTFSEAPTTGFLSSNNGSSFFNWQYLKASSSPTTAIFFIAPAYPATILPTGNVEFSVQVKGR